ncbi:MAG TPA: GTP 3',8-cyclase MoaA [Clostridia bacterium]|nr:GTP 3',8-cyclase MoaA [Clostridia bacterium]
MKDQFGREIEYLRISVTQNCNLKCLYCSPDGSGGVPKCPDYLSPEEFERIVRSMVKTGIRNVRITGGEPLTRCDICEIIERISKIEGIEDLSMTTNGINLGKMADKLKAAGLKRLNISMDSLKADKFRYITGGGRLEDTMKGIQKSMELGMNPVKINTVLIKGVNDDEIDDFIQLTKDSPLEVRFIELMPIGRFGEENSDKSISNSDIIEARPELVPCEDGLAGAPARYYRIEGYKGKVGFISPMSHKFCSSCNRIRLTCEGKIKPCLGNNGESDITEVLKQDSAALDEFVRKAIYEKPEGHNFGKDFSSVRNMSMIGG